MENLVYTDINYNSITDLILTLHTYVMQCQKAGLHRRSYPIKQSAVHNLKQQTWLTSTIMMKTKTTLEMNKSAVSSNLFSITP